MNGRTLPTPTAGPNVPPIPGMAEQLARIAHFRSLDHPEAAELDAVVFWLAGPQVPLVDAAVLWSELREPAEHLWHLITGDWDEDDLDELSESDWLRYSFATQQQEVDHRYHATRDRLVDEIESSVALARLMARETQRAAGGAR